MALSTNNDTCAPLVMGGYDSDFVDPPPDSLQCPVCLLPFRDPTLLSCCGHKGCASCIGRIKAAGHPCPLCQQPFDTMLDKQFKRKVLDLRVFCSKKREGCPWEGELRDQETHSREDCGHVEEECRYRCGGRYQRRFVCEHEMDDCPQRPLEVVTQSMIRKVLDENKKLTKKVAELEKRLQEETEQRNEDNAKQKEETALLQDEQKKLAKNMNELQEHLQSLASALYSGIVAVQSPGWMMKKEGTISSPFVQTTIVMPQFSQHKKDDDIWCSKSFYSWPGGYKLCLRVDANGYDSCKGTHLCVCVILMKGENDHLLPWPFEHDVTIGIINWKRNENHVIETIGFKNALTELKQRVTSGEMAEGGSGMNILSHSSLSDGAAKNTQYLHHDSLCLAVLKVEPHKE